jgi:phenol 2-monooxygenase
VVINHARVHDFYLQVMRNAPNRLEPGDARRLIDLRTDPAVSSPHSPQPETLRLSLSGMGGGRPKSL